MSTSAFAKGDLVTTEIKPANGQLLLLDNDKNTGQKTCMTICKRWGEKCILISKGATGGVERQCRRVCEAFGEECFYSE